MKIKSNIAPSNITLGKVVTRVVHDFELCSETVDINTSFRNIDRIDAGGRGWITLDGQRYDVAVSAEYVVDNRLDSDQEFFFFIVDIDPRIWYN